MRGFHVTLADGAVIEVPSTSYSLDDEKNLVFKVEDDEVFRLPAGSWSSLEPEVDLLAPEWPPEDLDVLVDTVRCAVDTRISPVSTTGEPFIDLASPLLNDREALIAELLTFLGIDTTLMESASQVDAVRSVVLEHFGFMDPED